MTPLPSNDTPAPTLRDRLAMSLVLVKPRDLDRRYIELHQRCAAGTLADDERAELDLMCAMKEAEGEE